MGRGFGVRGIAIPTAFIVFVRLAPSKSAAVYQQSEVKSALATAI